MKRVAILGCSGAGKSTLARRLGRATGIPVIHLDREFWNSGWVASESEEFRNRVSQLYEADRWIADGNYGSSIPDRLERADTVFILDFSTWVCLAGYLKRVIAGFGRDRPDCAEDCPERLGSDMITYICGYRRKSRQKIIDQLGRYPHLDIRTFGHRRELEAFMDSRSFE